MITFHEWLEERSMQEGSLGLQRRNRVAAGMAKRAERLKNMYSSSDSVGHAVGNELHKDVQAAAGRFSAADQHMRDRSEERLAKIARGDKSGRQIQAGRGNMAQIKSNVDASRDASAALANYNNPDALAQRGQDPNWAAVGGGGAHSFDQLSNSDISRASERLLRSKQQVDRKRREEVAKGASRSEIRHLDTKYPTRAQKDMGSDQNYLNQLMNR